MLFYYLTEVCKGLLVLLLIALACVVYTYFVNLQRTPDDPKKREYHPLAILLWPLTSAIYVTLLLAALTVFVLRALLFAAFLLLFTIVLVARRKPFVLTLWDKFATWVGDPLLEIGTYLIRSASGLWIREPQPA